MKLFRHGISLRTLLAFLMLFAIMLFSNAFALLSIFLIIIVVFFLTCGVPSTYISFSGNTFAIGAVSSLLLIILIALNPLSIGLGQVPSSLPLVLLMPPVFMHLVIKDNYVKRLSALSQVMAVYSVLYSLFIVLVLRPVPGIVATSGIGFTLVALLPYNVFFSSYVCRSCFVSRLFVLIVLFPLYLLSLRAAFLACFLSFLISDKILREFILFKIKSLKILAKPFSCFILTIALYLFVNATYMGFGVESFYDHSEDNMMFGKQTGSRAIFWARAIPVIIEKPVFGHGLNSEFVQNYSFDLRENGLARTEFTLHSDIFESLYRGGLLLTSLFVLLISAVLHTALKLQVPDCFRFPLFAFYIIALFYATTASLFVFPSYITAGLIIATVPIVFGAQFFSLGTVDNSPDNDPHL